MTDIGVAAGDSTGLAAIDWPAAIAALDDDLPCSGGENRMLRLAASLAGGIPVNLRDALTGLDDRNIQLVINAALHASGHRRPCDGATARRRCPARYRTAHRPGLRIPGAS